MSYIYKESFTVRASEINHLKRIHPHALISLMQEASMQHTISMGVSLWDLDAIKGSWVLLKMDVKFYSFPLLNEILTVETFPSGKEGLFTYRDYLLYDKDHNLAATASSQWALMHTVERKISRIPEQFGDLIYPSDTLLPRPEFKLKPVSNPDTSQMIKVNYFHLDWNGHVNNVLMCKIILETVESDLLYTHSMTQLQIQFKSEATVRQIILVANNYDLANNSIYHTIKNTDTGKDIVYAVSKWKIH